MENYLLLLVILLPFLTAAGVVAAGAWPNLREGISLMGGTILVIALIGLYPAAQAANAEPLSWLEIFPGLEISFRIEALGLMFALVAGVLWVVSVIYSIGYLRGHGEKHQTRFYCLFAVAIGATIALAFSANLLTLFVFYETLTLSTYPLVTHKGTKEARRAGRTYLVFLLGTSIGLFLVAIALTWSLAGTLTFTPGGILPADTAPGVLSAILLLYVFGIGKIALMPLHHWLPAAMEAPTPVSGLLHAVAVVKAGVFTLLKVCAAIFGFATLRAIPVWQWLFYLVAASTLLAAVIAVRQDNLKLRLAYSTISQLGYISMGALLANSHGAQGGALHIAMHAFGKITLFFCAGALLVAAHKSKVSELQGIGRRMPLTMGAFFIGSLCIIGLPPTGASWSKHSLLLGTLDAGQWPLMLTLLLSSLLSVAYLLPISAYAFFPGKDEQGAAPWHWRDIKEAPWPSLVAIVATALACIALLFYPQVFHALAGKAFEAGGI